jgi:alkanesulfonate monooxygenase SsuD/methylene tetrahydromethanopterin reductase-like flavin-dependent oxidoreductase (luciferase family)
MRFGIFDHCERALDRPAEVTYEERIKLVQAAEDAGFFAYHLAEHHGTPLSLAPSPNLFLAALAQRTSKIRLSALVYLLPLYDPYRLAQEICMLDGLSNGRLDIGIGRGANPIELSFFGLDPVSARDRFDEAFELLMQGLRDAHLDHSGQFYSVANAPVEVRPVQQPYPPIWYPSAGLSPSLAWAAGEGYNTIVNGPLSKCADGVKMFRDNFKPGPFGNDPKIGVTRYVFIADTEEEAFRVGEPAFQYHINNILKLARDRNITARPPIIPPEDLRTAMREGWAVVGSPDMVREQLGAIFDQVDNNYFVFAPMMAQLSLEWGIRAVTLFRDEIMPHFAERVMTQAA